MAKTATVSSIICNDTGELRDAIEKLFGNPPQRLSWKKRSDGIMIAQGVQFQWRHYFHNTETAAGRAAAACDSILLGLHKDVRKTYCLTPQPPKEKGKPPDELIGFCAQRSSINEAGKSIPIIFVTPAWVQPRG